MNRKDYEQEHELILTELLEAIPAGFLANGNTEGQEAPAFNYSYKSQFP